MNRFKKISAGKRTIFRYVESNDHLVRNKLLHDHEKSKEANYKDQSNENSERGDHFHFNDSNKTPTSAFEYSENSENSDGSSESEMDAITTHINIIAKLSAMRNDILFKKFMRINSYQPFRICYWSPEQIVLHQRFNSQSFYEEIIIVRDIVQEIRTQTYKSGPIHFICVAAFSNGEINQVCQMLANDEKKTESFLDEWQRSGAKQPKVLVCPSNYDIFSSACSSLNDSTTVKRYLSQCCSFHCISKSSSDINDTDESIGTKEHSSDPILPKCILKVHVNDVLDWLKSLEYFGKQTLAKFYGSCMHVMSSTENFDDFIDIFKKVCVLLKSEISNEHTSKYEKELKMQFKPLPNFHVKTVNENFGEILKSVSVGPDIISYFENVIEKDVNPLCDVSEDVAKDVPNSYEVQVFLDDFIRVCAFYAFWSNVQPFSKNVDSINIQEYMLAKYDNDSEEKKMCVIDFLVKSILTLDMPVHLKEEFKMNSKSVKCKRDVQNEVQKASAQLKTKKKRKLSSSISTLKSNEKLDKTDDGTDEETWMGLNSKYHAFSTEGNSEISEYDFFNNTSNEISESDDEDLNKQLILNPDYSLKEGTYNERDLIIISVDNFDRHRYFINGLCLPPVQFEVVRVNNCDPKLPKPAFVQIQVINTCPIDSFAELTIHAIKKEKTFETLYYMFLSSEDAMNIFTLIFKYSNIEASKAIDFIPCDVNIFYHERVKLMTSIKNCKQSAIKSRFLDCQYNINDLCRHVITGSTDNFENRQCSNCLHSEQIKLPVVTPSCKNLIDKGIKKLNEEVITALQTRYNYNCEKCKTASVTKSYTIDSFIFVDCEDCYRSDVNRLFTNKKDVIAKICDIPREMCIEKNVYRLSGFIAFEGEGLAHYFCLNFEEKNKWIKIDDLHKPNKVAISDENQTEAYKIAIILYVKANEMETSGLFESTTVTSNTKADENDVPDQFFDDNSHYKENAPKNNCKELFESHTAENENVEIQQKSSEFFNQVFIDHDYLLTSYNGYFENAKTPGDSVEEPIKLSKISSANVENDLAEIAQDSRDLYGKLVCSPADSNNETTQNYPDTDSSTERIVMSQSDDSLELYCRYPKWKERNLLQDGLNLPPITFDGTSYKLINTSSLDSLFEVVVACSCFQYSFGNYISSKILLETKMKIYLMIYNYKDSNCSRRLYYKMRLDFYLTLRKCTLADRGDHIELDCRDSVDALYDFFFETDRSITKITKCKSCGHNDRVCFTSECLDLDIVKMDPSLGMMKEYLEKKYRSKKTSCYNEKCGELSKVLYEIKEWFCIQVQAAYEKYENAFAVLSKIPSVLILKNREYILTGVVAFIPSEELIHYYAYVRFENGEWEKRDNSCEQIKILLKKTKERFKPALLMYVQKTVYGTFFSDLIK